MERPRGIVSVDGVPWEGFSRGERFGWRRKALGAAAGGEKLGCSLYELPPGRRSWPYHYHSANEEAIYVLDGSGTLRLDGREVSIAAGDYVALPAGKSGAHQVVNTSAADLRYLCFSTMIEPEVNGYPDSGKVMVMAGSAPGGPKEKRTVFATFPEAAKVGYWDGEG
jgi:uncharacterized cupin superfamily protein